MHTRIIDALSPKMWSFLLIGSAMFLSCANRISLGGGPRDENPPALDSLLSFQNEQTHYTKSDIVLFFDEYINLSDIAKQVVISPPLTFPPEIKARLKRLTLSFDEKEILKENATYVINFGESIADYTEGNKLENFTIVFSTGDYIDSLYLRGKVLDSFTGKPVESALVMLYQNFQDSVVYKDRPFYFAKTDKEGNYHIKNIRPDSFKLVALKDLNLNYLFETNNEEIAFVQNAIQISDSTVMPDVLRMFKESGEPKYKSYEMINQGIIRIEFDQIPDKNAIHLLSNELYYTEINSPENYATLHYLPRNSTSLQIEIGSGPDSRDTINPRINLRNLDTILPPINIREMTYDGKSGLHPDDTLQISFTRPVARLDLTKIIALDTSRKDSLIFSLFTPELPAHRLKIRSEWKENSHFQLIFLPGAIVDFFGQSNDSIQKELFIGPRENFGSIHLSFHETDTLTNYLLELLIQDRLISSRILEDPDGSWQINRLAPGSYSLRIIPDLNRNGRWDTGNYLKGRQPEEIFTVSLPELRSDWQLDEIIDFSQLESAAKSVGTSSETKPPSPPTKRQ